MNICKKKGSMSESGYIDAKILIPIYLKIKVSNFKDEGKKILQYANHCL
jgi:hypothetical protein